MEMISKIVQPILDLGPHIFVPLLIIIIGLCVKMKFKDAFTSALTLGVAFIGMSMVMNFMFDVINPAAQAFIENTGLVKNAIDVGWSPLSTIAWAWPYAFLVFPLQIGINLIMIWRKWTNCLNVDLWNVWGKILTAVFVISVSGSIPFAFLVAAIQIIFELKNADLTQKQIQQLTGIPGVSCPHSMSLLSVVLLPIDNFLKRFKFFDKDINADALKEKIGIFAENHVIGFIIGTGIGLLGKYSFGAALTLGVQCGTALLLFPMVAKLFMQALAPLSDTAGEFMKSKFPDREFSIGLDWPFLAGRAEIWVVAILLIPFILGFAMILPFNIIIPMAGIISISFIVPALITTKGNVLRMFVLGIITIPLFLFVGSELAAPITELGTSLGVIEVGAGQLISWSNIEAPFFRYAFAQLSGILNGNYIGIGLVGIWGLLWYNYQKHMKIREEIAAKELEEDM